MLHNLDGFSGNLSELLRDPQARELLARIRQLDSDALSEAAKLAASGDPRKARELLSPLAEDPDIRELTRQLRNRHGGI